LKDDSQGAKIIREASNGSNSSSLVGYVITEVNDQKITSASEAVALLDGLSRNGYRIKVKIIDLNGERGTYFF
jgi:S1-C subfamily serine protease